MFAFLLPHHSWEVSHKDKVPALFAALSRAFPRDFDFLFVSTADGADARRIMNELGLEEGATFPQLRIVNFVVKGARTEKLQSTSLDYATMSSFLEAYALAMKQLKTYGRKKPSHYDEQLHALTADTWDVLCPPAGPWLCVVGIDVTTEAVAVLAQLAKRFGKDQGKLMYFFADATDAVQSRLRASVGIEVCLVSAIPHTLSH